MIHCPRPTLVPYCDDIGSTRGDGQAILLLVLFEHDFDVIDLGVLNSELRVGVKKGCQQGPYESTEIGRA